MRITEAIAISEAAKRAGVIVDAHDSLCELLSYFGRNLLRNQHVVFGQLDQPATPIMRNPPKIVRGVAPRNDSRFAGTKFDLDLDCVSASLVAAAPRNIDLP